MDKRNGFTLIELLVVIAIIALLYNNFSSLTKMEGGCLALSSFDVHYQIESFPETRALGVDAPRAETLYTVI
jgi:prepilin-type N-terminal cleavage/methylation domain-containing protein